MLRLSLAVLALFAFPCGQTHAQNVGAQNIEQAWDMVWDMWVSVQLADKKAS
jgi:hypothetical protein